MSLSTNEQLHELNRSVRTLMNKPSPNNFIYLLEKVYGNHGFADSTDIWDLIRRSVSQYFYTMLCGNDNNETVQSITVRFDHIQKTLKSLRKSLIKTQLQEELYNRYRSLAMILTHKRNTVHEEVMSREHRSHEYRDEFGKRGGSIRKL